MYLRKSTKEIVCSAAVKDNYAKYVVSVDK